MKHVFVQWFVRLTEKYVWALANVCGLKVNRSGIAFGQHPITLCRAQQISHETPASCHFNTRPQ